jgi:hypothetical protein
MNRVPSLVINDMKKETGALIMMPDLFFPE